MSTITNTHRQFTPGLRRRLKTAGIGLGLTRLLLDAGRVAEARTTLTALQSALRHNRGHVAGR